MENSAENRPADDMFRCPVNRAMRVLDRSFFCKKIPLTAARIFDMKNISKCRGELIASGDGFYLDRYASVRADGGEGGDPKRKCMLLKPEIKHDDYRTWTPKVKELLEKREIGLRPYTVELDYDYWKYHDIMSSIMPEDQQDDLPSAFSVTGHIAHLNLRDEYLPYKNLIATVIMDKNPTIKTVINKLDDVGAENKFRTFPLEIIAGHKDLNVVAKEYNCEFRFNYADVYWNSRLSTEHARLISKFQKGEAVCDAMAGVGPFAVPAAKDKVFIWANDLNPHSYEGLKDAIARNKVGQFVRASNQDARTFIETTAGQLLKASPREVVIREKVHRRPSDPKAPRPLGKILESITQPRTFSHYVMNLPASATTFLDAFIGLYAGHERLFQPHTKTKLPMVHVYCFSTKSDDDGPEKIKICEEISSRIEHRIGPEDPEVEIWNVRNVAPNKVMFCASFRLPGEVAFKREVRS